MLISNERFYELLAEVVQNEGADNVYVNRYPWTTPNGEQKASVKVNGVTEKWVWHDLSKKWVRVVSEKA